MIASFNFSCNPPLYLTFNIVIRVHQILNAYHVIRNICVSMNGVLEHTTCHCKIYNVHGLIAMHHGIYESTGKGISTAAGAALVLAPYPLIVALVCWITVFKISRFVSLASIFAAAMLPVLALLFGRIGFGNEISLSWQVQLFFIIIGIVAVARHHANIKRLLEGTENRFEKKSVEDEK